MECVYATTIQSKGEVMIEWVWVCIGFVGQVVFGLRFVVQWIASEREKKSVIPMAFWYLSIIGSLILLGYAAYRRDVVFVAGFSLNLVIYFRNLALIFKEKKA